jgi:hypothetical protein
MATRVIHKVRITDQQTTWYAVIGVLDKVVVRGPNGVENLYDVSAAKAKPCIIDNTGAGNAKGDPSSCTRLSHMVRIKDDTHPDFRIFDVEVIDAVVMRGPNGQENLLLMPSDKAVEAILDETGSGLEVAATSSTTRVLRVVRIDGLNEQRPNTSIDTTSTDDPDYPSGPIFGKGLHILRTEALTMRGPNGQENLMLIPSKKADLIDTTKYEINKFGERVPPENTDPNHYLCWPKPNPDGSGATNGPLAAPNVPPIKQGPLWWIERFGIPNEQGKDQFSPYTLTVTLVAEPPTSGSDLGPGGDPLDYYIPVLEVFDVGVAAGAAPPVSFDRGPQIPIHAYRDSLGGQFGGLPSLTVTLTVTVGIGQSASLAFYTTPDSSGTNGFFASATAQETQAPGRSASGDLQNLGTIHYRTPAGTAPPSMVQFCGAGVDFATHVAGVGQAGEPVAGSPP